MHNQMRLRRRLPKVATSRRLAVGTMRGGPETTVPPMDLIGGACRCGQLLWPTWHTPPYLPSLSSVCARRVTQGWSTLNTLNLLDLFLNSLARPVFTHLLDDNPRRAQQYVPSTAQASIVSVSEYHTRLFPAYLGIVPSSSCCILHWIFQW